MEYAAGVYQRELVQFVKAVLVVQCAIGFAETRHVMTKASPVLKGYPNDSICWLLVLLGQSLVFVQLHHIEVGDLELLVSLRTSAKVIGSASTFIYPCT